MRVVVVTAVVLAALAVAFLASTKANQHITASGAVAVPIVDMPGAYVTSLLLTNTGPPDQLTRVTSADENQVVLIAPNDEQMIVVPGQTTAQLAADGVHVRIIGLSDDVGTGSLVPLNLHFANAGKITTRLRVSELDTSDHSMHAGMTIEANSPPPSARLRVTKDPTANGLSAQLELQNFTLIQAPEGAAHIDGEGHAHLYLNGLKLGRLYDTNVRVGPLLPGEYELVVTLNSHFHRVYTRDGAPIGDTIRFTVSP